MKLPTPPSPTVSRASGKVLGSKYPALALDLDIAPRLQLYCRGLLAKEVLKLQEKGIERGKQRNERLIAAACAVYNQSEVWHSTFLSDRMSKCGYYAQPSLGIQNWENQIR